MTTDPSPQQDSQSTAETEEEFSFDRIFKVELSDEIEKRKLYTYDAEGDEITPGEARGTGLPPFRDASLQSSDAPRSLLLQGVIDTLDTEEQNRAWSSYAQKQRSGKAWGAGAHDGLVGLALSGGGIRSATFNLGIIQALVKMRFLPAIDYLSTVSGGGYIGSCLTAIFNKKGGPRRFPFMHARNKPESPSFRHLRNNSEFLSPTGWIDQAQMAAVLIRGALLNFAVLAVPILIAAAGTVYFWEPIYETARHFWLSLGTVVAFLALTFTYPLAAKAFAVASKIRRWLRKKAGRNIESETAVKAERKRRARFSGMLAWLLALGGAAVFIESQPLIIKAIQDNRGLFSLEYLRNTLFSVGPATGAGALLAGFLLKRLQQAWSKFALSIIGIVAISGLWIFFLYLCSLGIDSTNKRGADYYALLYLSIAAGLAVLVFWMDINKTAIHHLYRDRLSRAFIFQVWRRNEHASDKANNESDTIDEQNIDLTERVQPVDQLKLSELNSRLAPYHLINAALNWTDLPDRYKRGRQSDFFIFSKRFTGGALTKYCKTELLEDKDPQLDLATAMAISGAAASAKMGRLTNRLLSVVMMLLNVRLNYWMPNPRYVSEKSGRLLGSFFTRGPGCLFREISPGIDVTHKSRAINVSDGGHLENTGIYQLLVRECRLIICGDGGEDPTLTFQAISELKRMAQVDLGISIRFDGLDEIRQGRQSHAVGTIYYREGRIGKLIYLKASLSGDYNLQASSPSEEAYLSSELREDSRRYDDGAYLASYHAKHPTFPHETTADQSFDEQQFECYRALGVKVALDALATSGVNPTIAREEITE